MLADLRRVQRLDGSSTPFHRLRQLLSARSFHAAGIDAPFSIPSKYLPPDGHASLRRAIGALDRNNRPFCTGAALLASVAFNPSSEKKPLRVTEKHWKGLRVSVRSTLWNGARPGAPMTAACLTLLHDVGGPIWPWYSSASLGLLVEAFPAAQLCHWGLPFVGYNGHAAAARKTRGTIIDDFRIRLGLDFEKFESTARESADALDAVASAFAAIAVSTGTLESQPDEVVQHEGWIAVHR